MFCKQKAIWSDLEQLHFTVLTEAKAGKLVMTFVRVTAGLLGMTCAWRTAVCLCTEKHKHNSVPLLVWKQETADIKQESEK